MNKRIWVTITGLLLPCIQITAVAETLYVPTQYPTIQMAIDAAADGDEVLAAGGLYFETIDFLGKAITVRSLLGSEATTIDGGGEGTVVTCTSGEGVDTVLEGFTITGGNATSGAGMYITGSPTINECRITGNTAEDGGGGVWSTGGSTFTDCVIDSNEAGWGVGLFLEGNPVLIDCDISENQREGWPAQSGGGIYISDVTTAALAGCRINGNSAATGAGISIYSPQGVVTVIDCMIEDNGLETWEYFSMEGGGIHANGDLLVSDSIFVDNWILPLAGDRSAYGGGLFNYGRAMIADCVFSGNYAKNHGGGVFAATYSHEETSLINCLFVSNSSKWVGGGVADYGHAVITAINCLFYGNESKEMGAMDCRTSSGTLINCTFAGNVAEETTGGLAAGDGMTLTNCVLWGNEDETGSDEKAQLSGNPTINYSCVEGWTGELGGEGNIGEDPLFVAPGSGDLRLSTGSPCIDAGDNSAVPGQVVADLDGNPRFVDDPETADTGSGNPPIVDMGAYEYQPPDCPADVTSDGIIDVLDLLAVLSAWGMTGDVPEDVTGDGVVDVLDLLEVLSAWGPC